MSNPYDMKKIRPTRFLLYLAILCVCTVQAQHPIRYYFRTLDIKDGLLQNTVNAILQDREGFIWFGTKDGLNRYDGRSFRIFKKEESTLGNHFVTALYEDLSGQIWVGTDAGVYIYHPETESSTGFPPAADTGESISRAITCIGSDARNAVWVAADNQGLFRYDLDTRRLAKVLNKDQHGRKHPEWEKRIQGCWILASAKRTVDYLEKELISRSDYFSSTLDANCEDKEASLYASTAAYYLALVSRSDERAHYAALARQAAYFALS